MEGLISLSRAKRKEDVIIARPFSPGLFQQGPAPYPTLLLEVLQGNVRTADLPRKLSEADARIQHMQSMQSEVLLRNTTHRCGSCGEVLGMKKFVTGTVGQENTRQWKRMCSCRVFALHVFHARRRNQKQDSSNATSAKR